jgi:hypothetical protein
VDGEVVLLGDAVEGADEGRERDGEPEAEEERAVPAGEIRASAAAQAQRRPGEEDRSERD